MTCRMSCVPYHYITFLGKFMFSIFRKIIPIFSFRDFDYLCLGRYSTFFNFSTLFSGLCTFTEFSRFICDYVRDVHDRSHRIIAGVMIYAIAIQLICSSWRRRAPEEKSVRWELRRTRKKKKTGIKDKRDENSITHTAPRRAPSFFEMRSGRRK